MSPSASYCLHQSTGNGFISMAKSMPTLLPAVQNRFNDLRREQGQSQDPANIGLVDLLGCSELGDRGVFAALNQSSPAVRVR